MNSTNPFVPQTQLIEQKNKNRARVKVAVLLIFALNILLISPVLLIQACKRDAASTDTDPNASGMGLAMTTPTNELPTDLSRTAAPALPGPGANTLVPPVASATPGTAVHNDPAPIIPGTPAGTGQTSEYVVVKGDNLANIAKNSSVTLAALRAANPGVQDTKLQIGQKLKIPPPTSTTTMAMANTGGSTHTTDSGMYVVKSGDNLTTIARNNHTTAAAIRSLNGLKTDRILVGDKLKIPGKATTSTPDTTTLSPAGPVPVMSNITPAPAPVVR